MSKPREEKVILLLVSYPHDKGDILFKRLGFHERKATSLRKLGQSSDYQYVLAWAAGYTEKLRATEKGSLKLKASIDLRGFRHFKGYRQGRQAAGRFLRRKHRA